MNRHVYTNAKDFSAQNIELKTNLLYSEDISVLGEQVTVGSKAVQNRLACQAMEGCDGCFDGSPDELTFRRYKRLAEGGAGMIWFEATACREDGRANPRQLWIKKDNLDSFKRIVDSIREDAIKANGYAPLIIMQATHSGRYSKPHGFPEPLIAYNNPIFEGNKPIDKSRILSDDELDRISEALIESSRLAEEAGFDGVDVKCCHRYINSELLSAYEREGKYGGSLENRSRLFRTIIKNTADAFGDKVFLASRFNLYDAMEYPYGFGCSREDFMVPDFDEIGALVTEMENLGISCINITMGTPYLTPHINRPHTLGGVIPEDPLIGADRMIKYTGELQKRFPNVALVGAGYSFFREFAPYVAAGAIKEGLTTLVGFGRMAFAYPDFASAMIAGTFDRSKSCLTCSKCTELMRTHHATGCPVRDTELYLAPYRKYCQGK